MRAVTIGQVLEHVEAFEDLLSEFYKNIAEHSSREGVRLLTDYMSRHSRHIRGFLGKLPSDTVRHLITVPLSYEPHIPDCHCFENIVLSPDADAAKVIDTAVLLDECLKELYSQVVEKPIDSHIKELFEGLIQSVEQDEIQLKKIKAMDYF